MEDNLKYDYEIKSDYEIKEAHISQAESLYRDFIVPNFPRNEVKPLAHIRRMMEAGYYKIITISDSTDEKPLGAAFITGAPGTDIYLLDYLAVDKDYRSKGMGGKLLQALAECYTDKRPIAIETESLASAATEEERQQRMSRNDFYKRNGAVLTDLVTEVYGVEYTIWLMNDNNVDITSELARLYHFMVNQANYTKYVFIPKK